MRSELVVRGHAALLLALAIFVPASCTLVYGYSGYRQASDGSGGQGAGGMDAATCKGCPDPSSPCQRVVCHGCKVEDEPAGTRFDPTPGDCRAFACDGHGGYDPVEDSTDVPATSTACEIGTCTGGKPGKKPAAAGTTCGDGLACDGMGSCAGCTNAGQCQIEPSPCVSWDCMSATCVPTNVDGAACGMGPKCTSGIEKAQDTCQGGTCAPGAVTPCGDYACAATSCATSCNGDGDCAAGFSCNANTCGKKPLGASCSAPPECDSGFCASSVCCDASCAGACQACSLSGHCGDIPDGTRCSSNSCDLNGHAVDWLTCASGSCGAPNKNDCSPYVCKANACRSSCSTSADCVAGFGCPSGGCCLTCAGWMAGQGTAADLCAHASNLQQQLQNCGCAAGLCDAQCAGSLCVGNAPDPTCLGCLGVQCPTNKTNCQNDVP